jgi:4-amino-4-deoxy-L-arabinose transferase-like glycosyltransferase
VWVAVAAAAVATFYLALTPWTSLWDRDEPRFAQAAVEMRASGQWLVPTFNGQLRADKPILASWLMAHSLGWLGRCPLAFRLWSPLALATAGLATAAIGWRLLGSSAGLWSLAILATSPLCFAEGVAATADALLLAAATIVLAVVATWLTLERPSPSSLGAVGRWLVMSGALCLGLFAKGPVVLAISALAIAGTLLLLRRPSARAVAAQLAHGPALRDVERLPVRGFLGEAALAAAVAIAAFCEWAIPANFATGGELARAGLGRHVLARLIEPIGGHGRNPILAAVYYGLVLWAGFFPWVSLLPAAIARLWRKDADQRARALLMAGTVPLFAFLTLVATKLPHYLLPAWPALAVMVGGLVTVGDRGDLKPAERRWLRRGVWLAIPPLLIVCGALAVGGALPWLTGSALAIRLAAAPLLAPVCAGLALVTAISTGAALVAQWQGRPRATAFWYLAGSCLVAIGVGTVVAPALDTLKPTPAIARAIRLSTPAWTPVAEWGFAEPSLVYELGRWPVAPLAGAADVAIPAWARGTGPGVLVTTRSGLDQARHGGSLPICELACAAGLDVTHGRWIDLVALTRCDGAAGRITGTRP